MKRRLEELPSSRSAVWISSECSVQFSCILPPCIGIALVQEASYSLRNDAQRRRRTVCGRLRTDKNKLMGSIIQTNDILSSRQHICNGIPSDVFHPAMYMVFEIIWN